MGTVQGGRRGRTVRKLRPRQGKVPDVAGREMAGPWFPQEEAEALFAALRAHVEGDEGPIGRWDRETKPKWLRTLQLWAPGWIDVEDLMQAVIREACKTVQAKKVVKNPGGWVSTVALNRLRKLIRRRKKEREMSGIEEEVPHAGLTPFEVAAEADEANYQRETVLKAARLFPSPYGQVLVWRLLEGLSAQKIRDRLNASRPTGLAPISERQAQHLVTEALRMTKAFCMKGIDPRLAVPQRYLSKKNRWIVAPLPLIGL